MSSNYPEGSMMGSGIYEEEVEMEVTCDHCDATYTALVVADDWGNINETLECLECGKDFTFKRDRPDVEDDYQSWQDDNHDN